jgi:hypothetical protein
MATRPVVLTSNVASDGDAEEFLVRLWLCLARSRSPTPRMRFRFDRGVTIEAEFADAAAAKRVAEQLGLPLGPGRPC